MTTIAKALQTALRHHNSGEYGVAESLYRRILEVDPAHVDALHLLGLIAHQAGKHDIAVEYIRKALRRKPGFAEAHNNLGNALKELGRVDDAVACYREALRLRPNYADAYNNLGNALKEQGHLDKAIASYQKALQLKPGYPDAHNNLGIARMEQGDSERAIASYRKAIRRKPDFPEAHNNLGNALKMQGKGEEALASYREALRHRPTFPEGHSSLGNALLDLGRVDEALASYREAIRLRPTFAEAYNNMGIALMSRGNKDEAVASYRQALTLRPDYPEAHNNLGIALVERNERAEGETHYREAIRLKSTYAEAHNNVGNLFKDRGELEEAERYYHEALRLRPGYPDAHNNLGIVLADQGKIDEADRWYGEALRLKPDYADCHRNRSFALLLKGDYAQGWPEYEWRWKCKEFGGTPHTQPQWDGAPLDGRTVLLHAEQGLGDTFQFIRYSSLVKERGGRVLFGSQKALVKLLSRTPAIDQIVAQGTELPPFDVWVPLLSLPALFKTTEETVPREVPYIFPDPALVERWAAELKPLPAFKVGIVWQGNKDYKGDKLRSIPLEHYTRLARVPGVQFFSLQKGFGTEQLLGVAGRLPITDLGPRLDVDTGPFMDTAAVMKNLDLVVTSDTSVVHLAGALGVPVWVALPLLPDWRWQLERDDNPWYPTMRLFRQSSRGDWTGVFERIAQALEERVKKMPAMTDRLPVPTITVEVAPGELIDKVTILEIKIERMSDPAKLINVRHERDVLEAVREGLPPSDELTALTRELKVVNEALWDIEDAIRVCERDEDFGPRFVELARSVYHQNDRRAALKRKINDLLGSRIVEEKSYAPYAKAST